MAPGSPASLREANNQRIVEAVKLYGGLTQVELATVTGLSPATVSNIVKQLTADDVLATTATTRSGRRAQLVTLTRSSGLAAGVHIGRRTLSVLISDASSEVRAVKRKPLPPEHRFDTTLDETALLVADLAGEVGGSLDDVVAVGIALPTRYERGPLGGQGPLPGWHDLDVVAVMNRRLSRPIVLVSEVEAAATAEARFGGLRGAHRGLHVRVGETTDCCVVIDGQPQGPGALGHVQITPSGPICHCGARGCLNTVVSAEALGALVRVSHGVMGLRAIVQAAVDGDPGCRQIIADAGAHIGTAMADLCTVLDLDKVTVGGPLAATGETLLTPIREALRSRPLLPSPDELFADTRFGADAETIGATALAHDAGDHPQLMSVHPRRDA